MKFTHFEQAAKFTDAAAELIHLSHGTVSNVVSGRMQALAYSIEQCQRFYLPRAEQILIDKPFDSFKDLIRLPYDNIALLTETYYRDRPHSDTVMITLAFNGRSSLVKRVNLVEDPITDPERGFYFINLLHFPFTEHEAKWIVGSAMAFLNLKPTEGRGVSIEILPDEYYSWHRRALDKMQPNPELADAFARIEVMDLKEDAISVANLCVLLNLHNVKTTERQPPKPLNIKRTKRGKLPLYSYKVLVVDNETWDKPEERQSTGDGHAFRSHLRRGHIRRLHASDRRVWVRATYVHGAIPGFVEKEYQVKDKRATA